MSARRRAEQVQAIALPESDDAKDLARHAPGAEAHVGVQVLRSSGENANQVESRVIDAVDGETAIELKDIEGTIDQNQFEAYLDLLRMQDEGGASTNVKKLKYVFTKPEGAIANLDQFADLLENPAMAHRVSAEVFDRNGAKHIVTNVTEARRVKLLLESR